jgi:zinc transporter ZupT
MTSFAWVAIFAVSAAIINAMGIWAVYKNKAWSDKAKNFFICFAAGVLITTPLVFAFPNAVDNSPYAGFAALAGFLFMYFSNQIIKNRTKQKELAFGITAVEGIGIHSFVDGVIYAVTFSVSIMIGILSGLGLVIHEFAEGVITFSILSGGGLSKKKAAIYAILVSSLTSPLGAFIAYPFVSKLSSSVLGLALGFVVGVLIYVSAAHLLPEARDHKKSRTSWAFLAGVCLALLIVLTKMLG